MLINTEPKQSSTAQKGDQDNSESIVAFRLTSKQLEELKSNAIKEKRSVSNFIKSKLF